MNYAKLKTHLPYILVIFVVSFYGFHLCNNFDKYIDLFEFSAVSIFIIICLGINNIISNGAINYFLIRMLGVNLKFCEGIGLASIHALANKVAFAGGLVTKGVYLKRYHKLSYISYISATFSLSILFISVSGAAGIISLIHLFFSHSTNVPKLLVIGFIAMASSILLFWVPANMKLSSPKWNQRLTQFVNGWQILRKNKFALLQLSGAHILVILIGAGRYFVAFDMLSQDVTFTECVLFSSATILTNIVAITPGGLGITEAIVVGVASMFRFDPGVALMAVGIDRLASTIVIVAMGTFYTYILSNYNKKITS